MSARSAPSAQSARGASLGPLALSLRIGAAYDVALALAFVAAPGSLAVTLGLPLPGERFYLWLVALLLSLLAGFYLLVARDPARHRELVWMTVLGRAAGAAVLAIAALGRPDLAGLWAPAAGDLAFAIAHALLARPLAA